MTSSTDQDQFRTNDLALRVQKKLASKMSGKTMAKLYIDERSGQLLDNLYRIIKLYTNNKKQAEKMVKSVIKVVIKSTLLIRNNQFSDSELALCEAVKTKVHAFMMSFVSFYELDFSYDFAYLSKQLNAIHTPLVSILQRHTKPKNLQKLSSLFTFVNNKQFMDTIFNKNSETYRPYMQQVVTDLNYLLDGGK